MRVRWRANDFIARLGPLAFRPGQEVRRFLEATPGGRALPVTRSQCVWRVLSAPCSLSMSECRTLGLGLAYLAA